MVNRVILIGNLGRDPEIRRFENGAAVAKFSIATNENYKDKSGEWQTLTEWHEIVAWRNLAERAESSLTKGSMVYLEGKLTTRTWQDQDGNNRKTTEVVANYFRVLNKRQQDNYQNQNSGYIPGPQDEFPVNNQSDSNIDRSSTKAADGGEIPIVDTSSSTTNQDAVDDLPF